MLQELIKVLASGKNVDFSCDAEPVLYTDAFKIRQIFQNLLSNAIKYNDKSQCDLKVSCERKNDLWQFTIMITDRV